MSIRILVSRVSFVISLEVSAEAPLEEVDDVADEADSVEDEEFLVADDIDEPLPVVERIVAPKGKPLAEVSF